ncbi:hypothetical protein [Ferviditalea candida]|uniref:hypothetical protein n=1 Tax=Ferviditalea candida TaxID=3108399 RepID=UPI00352DF968
MSYIRERFSQSIVIEKINYSFKNGTYWVMAYPENNKELKFQISESWNGQGLWDDYLTSTWKYEVNEELGSFVRSVSVDSYKDTASIYLGNTIPVVKKYTTIPYGKVPSYQDVKQELKKGTTIYISINRNYKVDSTNDVYSDIYKIIQFIKMGGYTFEHIYLSLKEDKKDSSTWKTFTFNSLENVNRKEDILKFQDK